MANLGSIFCTECGVKNSENNVFCINCGFSLLQINAGSLPQDSSSRGAINSPNTKLPSKKRSIFGTLRNVCVVFLILSIGASAGAVITAQGYLERVVGKRLTENESLELQKSAEKDGYELGLSDGLRKGKAAGLNEGKTTGIREGFKNGCNSVFDKIGESLIAIQYPWYDSSIYGFYWRRDQVCD
jgi:hypothetical protein